jgi:hypothetical protein
VAPEVVSPLTDKERADLELCEQALHGFRKALIVAGKALEVINRGRLYRDTHATFADYVLEVWGIQAGARLPADRGMAGGRAVSPIGDINEAQARELLPVFKDHGQGGHGGPVPGDPGAGRREGDGGRAGGGPRVLPARLAVPEQAADVLRVAAAEGRVPQHRAAEGGDPGAAGRADRAEDD